MMSFELNVIYWFLVLKFWTNLLVYYVKIWGTAEFHLIKCIILRQQLSIVEYQLKQHNMYHSYNGCNIEHCWILTQTTEIVKNRCPNCRLTTQQKNYVVWMVQTRNIWYMPTYMPIQSDHSYNLYWVDPIIDKRRGIPVVWMFNSRRLLSPRKSFPSDDGFHPSSEAFSVVVRFRFLFYIR